MRTRALDRFATGKVRVSNGEPAWKHADSQVPKSIWYYSNNQRKKPVGYPVGYVASVEIAETSAYAIISVRPTAHLDRSRHVLVLFNPSAAAISAEADRAEAESMEAMEQTDAQPEVPAEAAEQTP